EQPPAQGPLLPHPDQHALLDLLQEWRYGDEERGPALLHVLEQLVAAPGDPERGAPGDADRDAVDPLQDVRVRKERERAVVGPDVERVEAATHDVRDAAVRKDRPLGLPRRAGRVDDRGYVVGAQVLAAPLQ